jgi:hypothetical protein
MSTRKNKKKASPKKEGISDELREAFYQLRAGIFDQSRSMAVARAILEKYGAKTFPERRSAPTLRSSTSWRSFNTSKVGTSCSNCDGGKTCLKGFRSSRPI